MSRRGRKTFLSIDKERIIYNHIKKSNGCGKSIPNSLVILLVISLIFKNNPNLENTCFLRPSWAISFKRRWNLVIPRGRCYNSKCNEIFTLDQDLNMNKETNKFRVKLHQAIRRYNTPPAMVINIDQIEITIDSATTIVSNQLRNERRITILVGLTRDGKLLPVQLLYSGTDKNCLSTFSYCQNTIPKHWILSVSPSGKSNSKTMVEYVTNVLIPYLDSIDHTLRQRCHKPILVFDNPAMLILTLLQLYDQSSYTIRIIC